MKVSFPSSSSAYPVTTEDDVRRRRRKEGTKEGLLSLLLLDIITMGLISQATLTLIAAGEDTDERDDEP